MNNKMKKQIELCGKKVEYILKNSKRARRMRLAIHCGGDFIVTKPYGLNERIVESFIQQKSKWVLSKLEYFKQFKNSFLLGDNKSNYLKHKDNALVFARERVDYYNQFYNFDFNRISVKNQKTRWGSCSRKGNLNFNYKILFLPEKSADYIIVHELCHLGELNHSKRFWNLVAKVMPDYSNIRKSLKL